MHDFISRKIFTHSVSFFLGVIISLWSIPKFKTSSPVRNLKKVEQPELRIFVPIKFDQDLNRLNAINGKKVQFTAKTSLGEPCRLGHWPFDFEILGSLAILSAPLSAMESIYTNLDSSEIKNLSLIESTPSQDDVSCSHLPKVYYGD